LNLETNTDKPPPKRAWNRLDRERFLRYLQRHSPPKRALNNKDDLDKLTSEIHEAIQGAIELAVPWGAACERSNPWWNTICREAIHKSRVARRQWETTGSCADWEKYRMLAKEKGKVIQKEKARHWRSQVHDACNSSKGIWKLTKWATTNSNKPPPLPQFPKLKTSSGSLTSVFEEQVEVLHAKFFPKPPEADLTDINDFTYPTPLPQGNVITREGVRSAIYSPGLRKAAGPNNINNIALRLAYEVLEERIFELFQGCIQIGYHPKAFKRV
jgi:hypothetical protein